MATLVLSTVGTMLGGPIGGAIGSLIGQGIDQQLFGGGPREGPRLNDLSVQSSVYGSAIPRIYGTMRIAGSMIWATDLKENSEVQAGAKGQPGTLLYSYSASFAIALSSRPLKRIRRIWADGKLLRGADGDFKVRTGFRFLDGSEDQAIDPLIASVQGIDRTPAFRGLSVVIFEDLDLAEFGNRIPFLTFEAEADDDGVSLAAILADASGGAIECNAASRIGGYASYGSTIRASLSPLIDHHGINLYDDGSKLVSPASAMLNVDLADSGCSVDGAARAAKETSQIPALALPRSVALRYHDPSRDYQTGQVRTTIHGGGHLQQTIDLPATLSAPSAKALVETALARQWAERERLVLRMTPAYLATRPGTLVVIKGSAEQWRVEKALIDGFVTVLTLVPARTEIADLPADSGQIAPNPDLTAGTIHIALLDLPDEGQKRREMPVVRLAACSAGPSWRALAIQASGPALFSHGQTAFREAIMGSLQGAFPPGCTTLFDDRTVVDVQLFDADHWIESRDDEALLQGENLAAIGSELVQFGRALPLGEGRFRLSRFLRGRRGTEWAIDSHLAGEPFVMIDAATLRDVEIPRDALGTEIAVTAYGLNPDDQPTTRLVPSGEAIRPPSPVWLKAKRAAGGLVLEWVRRSRLGWAWLDEMDVPIGEIRERYRATISSQSGSIDVESDLTTLTVSVQELTPLGTGPLTIAVRQIGDLAMSRPVVASIA